MGLFNKLKDMGEKRTDKRIAKSINLIKNSKAIKEDRWNAILFFKELGRPEVAVPALLQRFEYSLEHGINDTREKEATLEAIKSYGDDALTFVNNHLTETNRIAWPIKTLKALGSEDQVSEVLQDALVFEDVAFDQAKVDKNYDILCYLADYQIPEGSDRLAHFLNDPDERVRFACAEVMSHQDDQKVARHLQPFLQDESSENTRLRQTVLTAFARNKWRVSDLHAFPNGRIDERYKVSKEGIVTVG